MNTMIGKTKPEPCYDEAGKLIRLGKELGWGGEGIVYQVGNEAAKVYTTPPDRSRVSKLSTMIAIKSAELTEIASWPTRLLYDDQHKPIGFLMPRVGAEFLKIGLIINPSSRPEYLSGVRWSWLVRTARELADIVGKIHQAGIVIGDVNERNFLVGPDARVRVIDTDSFQLSHKGRVWRTSVGVPDYTPPELQKAYFGDVERTQEHDLFGVAVMIFQILMAGWHPWAGTCHGFVDPGGSVGSRIPELPFSFSPVAAQYGFVPPSNAPQFASLPLGIAELFERAFTMPTLTSRRPSTEEWIAELEAFEQSLSTCGTSASHEYIPSRGPCPWCRLEYTIPKIVIFPPPSPGVCPAILAPLQTHRFARRLHLLRNRFMARYAGVCKQAKTRTRKPAEIRGKVWRAIASKRFAQWFTLTVFSLSLGSFWSLVHRVSQEGGTYTEALPTPGTHQRLEEGSRRIVVRHRAPVRHIRIVKHAAAPKRVARHHATHKQVVARHEAPKHVAQKLEAPKRVVQAAHRVVTHAKAKPPAGAEPVMISVPAKISSNAVPSQIYVPDLAGPEMPPITVHHSDGAPLPNAVLKEASGEASGAPKIVSMKLTPKSIEDGGESSLCVESANAHKVVVSRLGTWTYPVVCVPVHPDRTTTYTVTAINAQGKGVQRSITLTVTPTPDPATPDPEPSIDDPSPSPTAEGRHHHRHHRR